MFKLKLIETTTEGWLFRLISLGVLSALTTCYLSSVGAISATSQVVELPVSPNSPDSPRPSEPRSLVCRRLVRTSLLIYSISTSKLRALLSLSPQNTDVCLVVELRPTTLLRVPVPFEGCFATYPALVKSSSN